MNSNSHFFKPLLLIAVSVLLVLALLEGAASFFIHRRMPESGSFHQSRWAAFDEELGWRMQSGTWKVDILAAPMTVLEDGSRLVPGAPGAGEAPVALLLGGSYMLGYGVEDHQTLAASLQQKLGSRLRVVNMAVPGYGTWQAYLMLRRYLEEHSEPPEFVIYGFAHHHLSRNVNNLDWIRSLVSYKGVHIIPPHLRKSAAGEWTEQPFEEINFAGLADDLDLVYLVQSRLLPSLVEENRDEAQAATCHSLQRMEELCREHGIRFIAVNIFGKEPECNDAVFDNLLSCPLRVRYMDRRWFLTQGDTVSGHPNPDYYAAIAECVSRYLTLPLLGQKQPD